MGRAEKTSGESSERGGGGGGYHTWQNMYYLNKMQEYVCYFFSNVFHKLSIIVLALTSAQVILAPFAATDFSVTHNFPFGNSTCKCYNLCWIVTWWCFVNYWKGWRFHNIIFNRISVAINVHVFIKPKYLYFLNITSHKIGRKKCTSCIHLIMRAGVRLYILLNIHKLIALHTCTYTL